LGGLETTLAALVVGAHPSQDWHYNTGPVARCRCAFNGHTPDTQAKPRPAAPVCCRCPTGARQEQNLPDASSVNGVGLVRTRKVRKLPPPSSGATLTEKVSLVARESVCMPPGWAVQVNENTAVARRLIPAGERALCRSRP